MELRARQADADGKQLRHVQRWVPYSRISQNLKRAVLVAEDDAFWDHEGDRPRADSQVDRDQLERGAAVRGASTHHAAAGEEPLSVAVARPAAQAARADHRAPARGGAAEGAHLRDLPERDRVGRRHLGRRGGGAHLLRRAGVGAERRRRRRCWPARSSIPRVLQSCAADRSGCCGGSGSCSAAWAASRRRRRAPVAAAPTVADADPLPADEPADEAASKPHRVGRAG